MGRGGASWGAHKALEGGLSAKAEIRSDRLQRPVDDAQVVAERKGSHAGHGDAVKDERHRRRRAVHTCGRGRLLVGCHARRDMSVLALLVALR
jgi:hypothetical protein